MSDSGYLQPLPWETRNLGIPSFAVTDAFFGRPDEAMLKKCLAETRKAHTDFFVQARFKTDTKTSRILEANGFYFVEAVVCPYAVLSKCAALQSFIADPKQFLPARYKESDIEVAVVAGVAKIDPQMSSAIRQIAGESFTDDRFHVDHNCDSDVANGRFLFWIDDLFRDGSVRFHVLRYRKQPIAFMASRAGELLLAGFTRKYAGGGLGEFLWLRVLQYLSFDGVDRVSTLISVNNISSLNLHARMGFKFRDPRTTFHLWGRSLAA